MSIATPKADVPVQSEAGPAAQPDISAVMDLTTREIVHATVTGPTGSGKSAICGIIAAALKSSKVPVEWLADNAWTMVEDGPIRDEALAMYRPSVRLHEANVSRVKKDYSAESIGGIAHGLFRLAREPRGIDAADLLCGAANRFRTIKRAMKERDETIVDLRWQVALAKSALANDEQEELRNEIRDRTDELDEANAKWRFLKRESDELQVQLERFRSERPYVVGVNDGFEAAETQFSKEIGEQATEIVELRERCSGLYEAVEAAILKIRGMAGADESDVEFLKKALGQPQDVDVDLRAPVRDDAIKAAYAPGADEPEERRRSPAIIHFQRLVTIRLVLEALETKFGSKAIGKTNVCEAMLDTVEFMQGAEFVRPRADREKRGSSVALAGGEFVLRASADGQRQGVSLAGINEAVLGVRS